jgi:TonB-linked SusC/RagA family outer membrane protein
MKKNRNNRIDQHWFVLKKAFFVMKLTTLILLISTLSLTAGKSYSQNTRISLSMTNAPIKEVLLKIENSSDFFFIYNNQLVDVDRTVSVKANNERVKDILADIFKDQQVEFQVTERKIVISPSILVNAQTLVKVSGKVTDSSGGTLPGVSVSIKGTTAGTITDSRGNYSLSNVPENATLQFSFVGMKMQEVKIDGKSVINVALEEETFGIEEVVAVGYGTVKKANLTGATSSVNFSKLESRPSANTATLLQGQMAGVTVSNYNTQPGNDNPEIRIRGIGTFNAGQNPLVIVDGVESSLTQIPSADIESVSVLKDAASAAIYGVRAANGVILVTTKRGSVRKPVVTIKQNTALQKVLVIPDMVDSWEYADIINMGLQAKGSAPLYTAEMIQKMKDGSDPDNYANTDWVEEMFQLAPMNTSYVSVDGGTENVKYLLSGEYFDQTGILLGTSTKRYSFRSNIDVNVSKKVKLGMDISGHTRRIDETLNSANESDGNGSIFYTMRRGTNPTVPVKFQNGQWGTINGLFKNTNTTYANPIYLSQKGVDFTNKYFFQGRVYADIEPVKNLNYRVNLAGVYNSGNQTRFSPSETFYYPDGEILSSSSQNALENNNSTDTKYIFENLLTYKLNIENHQFSILLGQSAQFYRYDYLWASVKDLPNDLIYELSAGVNEKNVAGNANEVSLQSFFSRINYNYKDKYLLEMNIRRDGSSRMPKESRYGVFPSFSGAWIISNENFLEKSPFFSFLKLRASWGQLGNQEIGNYAYVQNINLGQNYVFGDALTAGAALTSLANDKIKWETTTILDFGVDFNLFNNKLQVVADWFDKTSSNILVTLPIPQTLGNLSAPYQNIADVRNSGVEIDLKYNGKISDLNYFAGLNFSVVENEILNISGLTTWISNGGRNINLEGYPINSYYGLIAEGYFQTEDEIANSPAQFTALKPGDVKFRDISGPDGIPDGKIDENYDREVIGSPFPKLNYSFNLGGSYKGFDLYCFFQGISGIDRYFWYNNEGAGNFSKAALNYWKEDNPNADNPRFGNETNNNKNSTLWLKDASYLRLKNLEVGYTLPKTLTKKISIEKTRLYVSGTNLLTFTKVVDFDPEKIVSDERNRVYPQAQVYSVGLNITF